MLVAALAVLAGILLVGAVFAVTAGATSGLPALAGVATALSGLALGAAGLTSASRSPYPARSLLLTGASVATYLLVYFVIVGVAEGG